MVRMTGTASADQEPIWAVYGRPSWAGLLLSRRGLQRARPSLARLASRGVMSSRVKWRSGQWGVSHWQRAVHSPRSTVRSPQSTVGEIPPSPPPSSDFGVASGTTGTEDEDEEDCGGCSWRMILCQQPHWLQG